MEKFQGKWFALNVIFTKITLTREDKVTYIAQGFGDLKTSWEFDFEISRTGNVWQFVIEVGKCLEVGKM